MYMGTEDLLVANIPMLSALPHFQENLTAFQAILASITDANEQQSHKILGIATGKHDLREALIVILEDLTRKIGSYAGLNNNAALMGEVNVSKSIMEKMTDAALLGYAEAIHHVMTPILPALEPFGVMLNEHIKLLDTAHAYEDMMPAPRAGVVSRKTATTALKRLFDEADNLLDKIDLCINIIKQSNIDFYTKYKNTRKLIPLGVGGAISIKGTVTETGSNMLLGAVKIKVSGGDRTIPNRWTTATGHFEIDNLPEGTYSLTAERPGYRSLTIDVAVAKNTSSVVNIQLNKIVSP